MKSIILVRLMGIVVVLTSLFIFAQMKNSEGAKESRAFISPEEAQVIACNKIQVTETGVELSHPNHFVQFEAQGVSFQPKSGPEWKWKLEHIGVLGESLKDVSKVVKPESHRSGIVEYRYGDIVEEYHAKLKTVEQRFVLEKPLDLKGQNLVIRGSVESEGQFKELEKGWAWADSEGQVALGDVTVFDAQGSILIANMNVNAHQTEIVVDAQSLATAVYPVTVDPEIGANDVRISDMGPDGAELFGAFEPAVVYNSTENEYFVVWRGSDQFELEDEIFIQRIDATTGLEIGMNDFQISDMGPAGDLSFTAMNPAVAYNSTDNEYLVVWWGDDDVFPLVDGDLEIFGQRLDASGSEIGANDFRISDMGPSGDIINFRATNPAVAHNSTDNEYLVVWEGEEFVDGEFEIYGQRLDSFGVEIGANDFLISDMGPNGDKEFDAIRPAVVYNSISNEYFVVWQGDDDIFPLVDDEFEIFGQLLSASGVEIGANDFRISDMGLDGRKESHAIFPDVAHNTTDNEYLVVWEGNDVADPEVEIYGQLLNSSGAEIGSNDFRISDMGPDGDIAFDGNEPSIVYSLTGNEYLVVWEGNDSGVPLVASGFEIFAQRIDASGAEIGENDVRISDMGPDGITMPGENAIFDAFLPAVAYSFVDSEYFIVWHGDDDISPLVDNEFEIFRQRFKRDDLTPDVNRLSLSAGGTQKLTIDLGPNFAGLPYLMLGSLSGTSPGVPLGGGETLPLNPSDAYFMFTLMNPNAPNLPNGFGILDSMGRACVSFVLPPGLPGLTPGTIVNHAALIMGAQQSATNAVSCELVP